MICGNCKSERVFEFEPGKSSESFNPGSLPSVCRDCGEISVGGVPVNLSEALAKPIRNMAEASSSHGKRAREDLHDMAKDPEMRIQGYMENFYSAAYLDGFWRAIAFFRHNAKEGRICRLRELWLSARLCDPAGSSDVVVRMDGDQYTEFERLLHMSAVGGTDVKGTEDRVTSKPESDARVPRRPWSSRK